MIHSLNKYLCAFFFEQPRAILRISLLRIIVIGIALVMLTIGPYDTIYHTLFAPIMFQSHFPFIVSSSLDEGFIWIKLLAYGFGFFALIGFQTKVTFPLFTICYCILNYYIHCFQEHYCMNQAHLNLALLALIPTRCAARFSVDALITKQSISRIDYEKSSFVLTFLGGYIALLFFQTGLSKLIYGGIGWFLSGDTLYVETIFDGTDFGRYLTQFDWVFPLFGIGVFFFELIFPFFFFFYRYHFFFGLILLGFHFGTYLVMGISFWFLWPLYIPLFLMFKKSYYL